MQLFHGTRAQLRETILREGLRSRTGGPYLTSDRETALMWGYRACGSRSGLVLVVTIRIPDSLVRGQIHKTDLLAEWVPIGGYIAPERIVESELVANLDHHAFACLKQ